MKIILFLLFLSACAFPQEKNYISFKDKGDAVSKIVYNEQTARTVLSEESIMRRKLAMGEDNFLTYEDLPVNPIYIEALERLGIKIENRLSWFNSVSAYLTEQQKAEILKLEFVREVVPVRVLKYRKELNHEPLPPYKTANGSLNYGFSLEQNLLSDIPQVHEAGITGKGVRLGLLDSGFNWRFHESLKDRKVIAEYDFIFKDTVTADETGKDRPGQHSHGTSVFSAAGGYKDSALIGPAYDAEFILAKTEDIRSETHLEEDNYAAALIWMDSIGVDIVSSSLGYNIFDQGQYSYSYEEMDGKTAIVTQAVNKAFDRGIVTITSAGNEGGNSWGYITAPADAFNIISVGAVSNANTVTGFSSRGPTADGRIKPEVVAQGFRVLGASANSPDGYNYSNGTSLSAPIAAGTAALLKSAYPHLTNVQIRNILIRTAGSYDNPDNNRGYGLISAAKAIEFPNLNSSGGSFVLNKAFIMQKGIDPASVTVNFSDGRKSGTQNLQYQGSGIFSAAVPAFQTGEAVDFYFNYKDSSGNNYREPLLNSYRFVYGSQTMDIQTVKTPDNYVLSQNYPNPFNNSTRIDFISEGNEQTTLLIIDAIGQKVKLLFSGVSAPGLNTVVWDGKSDNGIHAASGVYYYILKMGGKEYGQKMVLLK